MRNRRLSVVRIGAIVVGAAAVLFLVAAYAYREPSYQRRTLTSWLADLTPGGMPESPKNVAAGEAVRQIGSDAIPYLLDDLVVRESRLRTLARNLLTKQKLIPVKIAVPGEHLDRGVRGFEALGEIGLPALPELQKLLPHYPGFVPRALAGIGPSALPAITNALCHTNPFVRWNMAVGLANAVYRNNISHEQASIAVPFLVNNLSDTNDNGKIHAVMGLKAIARMPEISVPRLTALLTEQSSPVQREAAEALGSFGADAKSSAPFLEQLLSNTNTSVAAAASGALSKIDPNTASAVPILNSAIALLNDPNDPVRMNALRTLGRLTNVADRAAAAITNALLGDQSPTVRFTAAGALGVLNNTSDASISALTKALEDADEFVRLEAANALRSLGTNAKAALSALINVAKNDASDKVRGNARAAVHFIDSATARREGF
ncbi:MAG: hypothetical protein FJ403_17355 [Verrucomicrobia bacterium]|nr:hypothetical protein [Verrucomicrobiota bacterium]